MSRSRRHTTPLHQSTFRRNAASTLLRHVLSLFVQMCTVILVARALGPEGNGIFSMIVLLPTVLVNLLNFGVGPSTVFYLGRGRISGERAIRENRKLALLVSVIGFTIAAPLLAFWSDEIFPGIPRELMAFGLSVIPVSLMIAYWQCVFQGMENFRIFNWIALIPPFATLVFTAILFLFVEQSVVVAILAYVVGQIVALSVIWCFVRRVKDEGQVVEMPHYKRTLLTYGWKAHLSNIMAFINYRADIFLVNFFLSPSATGLYVVSVQIAERLWIFSHSLSVVLFPRLSAMYGDPIGRHRLTIRAGMIVGIVTTAMAFILVVATNYFLVPLFGKSYEDSFQPFVCLLPGIIIGAVSRVYANSIAAAGKPEWNFYVSVVVVTTNVVGNCVLIPRYGLIGAAISTSVAYAVNGGIKVWLIQMVSQNQSMRYR